jgi:diguanylate cyclase (GGDEF)-like protein
MISLKKYLDQARTDPLQQAKPAATGLLPVAIAAYVSALREMGRCSVDACPALGEELKQGLAKAGESLSRDTARETIEAAEANVRAQLQDWGRRTARHFQHATDEVKEILIVMARTAESVGERDQRCARQITDVTARLQKIANLEDLSEIRVSIEQSAAELKSSIDRMAAEGKAAVEQLRVEVTAYQVKLEAAEHIASCDSLTGLRSRLWVESQIERSLGADRPFCVVILDIDAFKLVNDHYGHLVGDELLIQFSTELRSACRSTDIVGRWGGDEFIILLDCGFEEAKTQTLRMKQWVCGSYTVHVNSGAAKLRVDASFGLAERIPGETVKELLARADADMYSNKTAPCSEEARAKR